MLFAAQAEAVEEDVARDGQRLAEGDAAVRDAARVLERDAADLQRAAVEERRVGRDQPALERRDRRDQLERGAGRVAGLGGAVEQRLAVLLRRQPVEVPLADDLGEDVRVERRRGCRARRSRRSSRSSPRTRPRRRRAPAGPRAGRRGRSPSRSLRPGATRSRERRRVLSPSASTCTRVAPFSPRRKRS